MCYCLTISQIENSWPIHILQHLNESKHPIGTARIAQLSLSNCKTYISKNFSHNLDVSQLIKNTNPLLIYPGEGSISIEEIDPLEIREIIFLDGSWRKTRRMIYETPELQTLTKVSFTAIAPSSYRIRKEPNDTAVSTLEAIVTVMSKLENEHHKYQPLLKSMEWMINTQIERMGKETYEKNYSNEF